MACALCAVNFHLFVLLLNLSQGFVIAIIDTDVRKKKPLTFIIWIKRKDKKKKHKESEQSNLLFVSEGHVTGKWTISGGKT